jgi:1,4-alpha-glucan branching enzyme
MGLFALVLHTHLPYVRRNGVSPCGEDFFHEAAFESWLPLLDVLERLPGRARLSIGVTPVLANQWEDPHLLRELSLYLGRVELGAWSFVANPGRLDSEGFRSAAADAAVRARSALARLEALPGGIASGYAALGASGMVELLGGPATHPLLPMVGEPALQRAQVALGASEHHRIFGARPSAMWLPECAYVPGRGVEEAFAAEGVRAFVVDQHMAPATITRTGAQISVAAFDRTLVDAVWADGGYPADPLYREFTGAEYQTGLKLFRVTVPDGWATMKEPYDPGPANRRAAEHAAAHVELLERRFAALHGSDAVLIAAFDTELFGHWWREGPAFLGHLMAMLASHPSIRPVTLSDAIDAAPAAPGAPAEGSWGAGGDLRSWVTAETEDMWAGIRRTEKATARLVAGRAGPAADQLLREQFLLSASDWTFMAGLNRNAQYGRERFAAHLGRWEQIASALETRSGFDPAAIAAIDNPFPDVSAARHVIASSLPSFDPV